MAVNLTRRVLSDPRPEFVDDTHLWQFLFVESVRRYGAEHELVGALRGARSIGSTIVFADGMMKIRPPRDEAEAYAAIRPILARYVGDVTQWLKKTRRMMVPRSNAL